MERREKMTGAVLTLLVGSACIACAAVVARAGDSSDDWNKIAPLFEAPAGYRGDYGTYSSVLAFEDGRQVRTAAEWRQRRDELRREWMRELGPWPQEINAPSFK